MNLASHGVSGREIARKLVTQGTVRYHLRRQEEGT
jgi:hypothetical protein